MHIIMFFDFGLHAIASRAIQRRILGLLNIEEDLGIYGLTEQKKNRFVYQ
jgi:hypothetical protein